MAQNTVLKKPTRVVQAQSRLDQAVARLEHAIQSRPVAASGDEDGQLATLQAEVQSLRSANAGLKQVNDQVAGRLDTVIANLKTALDD